VIADGAANWPGSAAGPLADLMRRVWNPNKIEASPSIRSHPNFLVYE